MNYYNELLNVVELFLNNNLSLFEAIKLSNNIYDKMLELDEDDILSNRVVNDILLEIINIENSVDLTSNNLVYETSLFNTFMNLLKGEETYFEIYKVLFSYDDFDNNLRKDIDDAIITILKGDILSQSRRELLEHRLQNHDCLRKEDIVLFEIINSILLINKKNKLNNSNLFVGTLGINVDKYNLSDEIAYLKNLYLIFKGDYAFRFTIMLKGNIVLYTNINIIK